MKITREHLKNIVKETMIEESEYQEFFKKALEKAGKSIPAMSDEEKKAFFNKIEKTWNDRGNKNEGNAFGAAVAKAKKDGDDSFEVDGKEYKTERFGRGHEGPTFGSEDESLNEIKYDTALADFNKELEKNSEVKKAAKHYNKSVKDVVKVLQSRIKVNRYSDKSIKRVSIDFKEDGPLSSKVSIKLSKDYKQNESVNESIEPQIKKIAYYTGTRPEAVEDFVSKHVLNITKLLKYVEKGGLPQRMELVSALAGRPNNPKQKKIIKQFQESVNEANSRDEYDAKEFWGVSKMGIQLHKQFKGRFNKSKFEKALSDLIGKSKRPESTIKIIGRYLNIKPSKLNSYTSGEIIEDQEFIKDSTKKAEQLYNIFLSSNESVEKLMEKNVPTNPGLWARAVAAAKKKYDVYPSAYANGFASKWYGDNGGKWKTSKSESVNERQLKGLDGIDSKTPLSKISDTQKLKIIQGTGNNISFKVPKGFNRNFWQVFSKGKIKKKKSFFLQIIIKPQMAQSTERTPLGLSYDILDTL